MRHEAGWAEDRASILEVDGVLVHYRRQGRGTPVVLVHGASGNLRDWTMGAMDAMAQRHDVIAFDRAGLGLSGWPGDAAGVRLSEQGRLMRGALEQLGVERVILAGHSYGGSVVLAWALDAPQTVAGLMVLSAPSHPWPGGLGITTDLLASPLSGPALARAVPALLPRSVAERAAERVFAPQSAPEGYLQHLGYERVVNAEALRRNAMQLAVLKAEVREMAPRYGELAMPVEALHGTADEVVPLDIHSEPLAAAVPDLRLTRLRGIGHMPHHVALPEVLAALERLASA